MARRILGIVIGLVFVAALLLATSREAAVECEVCMEFAGKRACRTSSATDRDGAQRGATTAACAVLASGVTQGMSCDRTPPRSVRCSD